MICPHCGADMRPAGGMCTVCNAEVEAPVRGWDPTRVGPAPGPVDPDRTVITRGGDQTVITGAPDQTVITGGDRTVVTPPPPTDPFDAPTTRFGSTPPPPKRRKFATGETGPLSVGQGFGTRYHVIKVLGIGGMGAVYHVWDDELGQAVALKVVRPEAAEDPATAREMERRFKQELVLARQVTHKNVVRIHDLGEIEGIKYITMPYLDGEDLATALTRDGKVPVPTALRIIRDVASGLVAAHEAGIVHRDLKPANIMLVGDHAIIMDFGIARSATRATPAVAPTGNDVSERMAALRGATVEATMAGTVLGTVEYMAPEQARGEEVDQRADVYALGLIFSDMLIGRRRQPDVRPVEELKKRMEEGLPSVRSVDESIPEATAKLIAKCIERDPAARFQTSAELVAELNLLDERGKSLPIYRTMGARGMTASVAVFLLLLASTFWFARGPAAPVQHDPVSVVIADFQNSTGDPTFDRTLEPMLKMELEGAGFISAYSRSELRRNLDVRPPDQLTEEAAHQVAVGQGLGIVLSGSVRRDGNRYIVSMKAAQAVTGEVVADVSSRTNDKNQVLSVATDLAAEVREALGDDTSESAQRFGSTALSATSMDVVRDYVAGMDAMSSSRFEDARVSFSKAVERDPTFGLGYANLAMASRNLDKQQDAEKYVAEALKHLDNMTERERYRTRALSFLITSDSPQCVKEYGELVARYPADAAGHNNLALCLTYLRDLPRAMDEMRKAIDILPKRALYRENFSLYAAYSSDFKAAEQEAKAMQEPGLFGLLPLAFAQILQGQLPAATETYRSIGMIDAQGTSYAISGLGDLALYEGRLADAARIFEQGAAADVASKDADRAARKFAALAYTQALRQQNGPAIAAADKALAQSNEVKIRFLAARVFVEAGATEKARTLAASLAKEFQAEPQAYAKIIEGESALKSGDARLAIKLLTEANALLETWMGHFDLGRAFLEDGRFLQADSEFDRCITHRGEALALFLDEEPTYGFFPPVYYYQGRVREGLGTAGYAESYRAYLAIRGNSKEDALVPDVRRRVSK